ncbi:hypothetical protein [Sulfurovum mangrovi]|uniref:hypothetical protein n=1 Tax=Sulfurovum mangrovi TaxID=2893889 RepID=UPI001E6018CD|nr:hypothetical protein [Sulfurovum mangrovi]UFH58933.1 hypothetical protein LN246_11365 [Sulfurovum mangrovi]
MIVIGHPWIESPKFCKVFSEEDIKESAPDTIVLLEPLADSHKLAAYCQKNDIAYAVPVNKLKEAIFANALGASYIICEEDDAMMVQPIAQEYLFDTRVLVLIHEEKEMTKIARSLIDGVIFAEAIL